MTTANDILTELSAIGYHPDPDVKSKPQGRPRQAGRAWQADPRVFSLLTSMFTALSCMPQSALYAGARYASSCIDSGATVDVLGREHCDQAENVQDANLELGTAGETVSIRHTGDCVVEPGIAIEQGYMAPWLDMTLISLTKKLSEGYSFMAEGMNAVLVSPTKHVYRYIVQDGLIVPDCTCTCEGAGHHACEQHADGHVYTAKDVWETHDIKYKTGKGQTIMTDHNIAVSSALMIAMTIIQMTIGGASIPLDILTQALPLIAAAQGLAQSSPRQQTVAGKRTRARVRHKTLSSLEHCRRGHCPHDPSCEVCRMSRMRRKQARARGVDDVVADAEKGYVLGIDFFGPFDPDVDNNVYGMIGVEVGHTRYGMVELTRDREAKHARDGLMNMMRDLKHAGPDPKDVARVHTDDDTSFKKEFQEELLARQIRQTNTGGYRPSNNSMTERRIGLLLSSLRAVLYTATGGSRYYDKLWGPALKFANSMVNRGAWSDGSSPYQARVGKEYEWVDDDHVFGAKCIYWVPKEKRDLKWITPGREGIWVGRSDEVTDGHIVIPIEWDGGGKRYVLGPTVIAARADVDDETFPLRSGPVDTSDVNGFDEFMERFHHQMYGHDLDFTDWQVEGEDPILEVEMIVSKKNRGKKTQYLVKWKGSDIKTWEPIRHLKGCREEIDRYESQGKAKGKIAYDYTHRAYVINPISDDERAVTELIHKGRVSGNVTDWMDGYKKELEAVTKRRLEPVDVIANPNIPRKAIRMRMRLEAKKDGRRKGRLIVQGFREPQSWDVGGTDSPVASIASIRTLLFMAGLVGDVISSIDVSTAFLQSNDYPPDHEPRYVYYQPYKNAKKIYYRLKGCLYGQRSASMQWHKTISGWLESPGMGFVPGKNDPCVYVNKETGMRLALVVDDILCRGPMGATVQFYKDLEKRFEVKDPTYLTDETPIKYVGFDIRTWHKNDRVYISIDQRVDLENYLSSIEYSDGHVVSNPMSDRHVLTSEPELLNEERASRYRSVVGTLNYYACALRYDIAYPVSRLSQYSNKPTVGAEKALNTVLAYLSNTTDFAITCESTSVDDVACYADSDHAGDKEIDSRSQSSCMILLNNAPVFWKSTKQPVTSLSSACAEIYALSESVKQMRLFQWRAEEYGVTLSWSFVVQVDNSQAKSFAEGTCVHSKLRGTFDVREKWVAELRDANTLIVEKIDTTNNLADLMTKTHSTRRFRQLLNMIGSRGANGIVEDEAMRALVAIGERSMFIC